MAVIVIKELTLPDHQNFLIDINSTYSQLICGGYSTVYNFDYGFQQLLQFAYSILNFVLRAFGIYAIVSLTYQFHTFDFFPLVNDSSPVSPLPLS